MSSLDLIAGKLGLVQKNNDDFKGFDGIFLDDVRERESLDLSVTIPNTYVEDGNYVNDHTIFNPKKITIEGMVGEVYRKDSSVLNEYFRISETLGVIDQYIPIRSSSVIQKIDNLASEAIRYGNIIDNTISDIGYVKNSFSGNNETIRKQFVDFVNTYLYEQGNLIFIETGLGYFSDMKLISATISGDNQNIDAFKYKLTFQKWRTAKTILTPIDAVAKNPSGDAEKQTAKSSDKGNVKGKSKGNKNQSLLNRIIR